MADDYTVDGHRTLLQRRLAQLRANDPALTKLFFRGLDQEDLHVDDDAAGGGPIRRAEHGQGVFGGADGDGVQRYADDAERALANERESYRVGETKLLFAEIDT